MSTRFQHPKLSITREQLLSLQQSFLALDRDGNGYLDENELETCLQTQGLEHQYAPLAMKLFDTDRNGQISWKEFLLFCDAVLTIEQNPDKFYRCVFDSLDDNQSGTIDEKELYQLLGFLGQKCSKEELHEQFVKIDTDKDGALNFEEVKALLQF